MRKRIFLIIFLAALGGFILAQDAFAGSATVSWNANTESDLAGYKVYYGTSPRSGTCPTGGYPNVVNVGNVTTYTFSSLTDGATYYFSVTAYDTSGNESTCSTEVSKAIPADTTSPTISSVSAGSVTSSGATITWTTNEASDTQVEYGLTTSYGFQTTLNASMVTSHSQALSGLSASTLYHYRVKSKDAAGNLATSGDYTLTTSAAPDTQAPTVSLTAPSSGSTVSGTITVSANASDNVGVVGVQFKLDAANLGAEDTTSPYSVSWNTTTATNGSHNLVAVARDAANNRATSTAATITVDNAAPTVSSVTATSITYNSAVITWTTNEASDSQVEYGLTASYGSQTTLNTSMVTSHSQLLSSLSASTLYHYRVKSKDAAGNLATSGDYTFTTAATPTLTVALSATPNSGTAPLNGVDLSATVGGNVTGNINYTFYCNRSDTGTNITTPYQGKYDNQTVTTYNAVDICNYSAAGSYSAKVIVERGTYQAEARTAVTVATPNYAPIGNIDGADATHVTGWAYDQNAGATPINVHVYIDGAPIANITANLSRPDIVGAGGGVVQDANHGFDYAFSDLTAGNHTINVYAINTPAGTNPELSGSPKTITVTVAITGDLNSDSRINAQDFSILMSQWGSTSKPVADINKDGYVNAQDFSILLSHWTG